MAARVLVVDDSIVTGKVAQRYLEAAGYQVKFVPDGPTALQAVEDQVPDLILLDVVLPGIDGIEVCRRLRKLSITRGGAGNTGLAVNLAICLTRLWGAPATLLDLAMPVGVCDSMLNLRPQNRLDALVAKPSDAIDADVVDAFLTPHTSGLRLLAGLEDPVSAELPIVVVQHIAAGFVSGLVSWLQTTCRLSLKVAEEGEMLAAGQVYFAPEGRHLVVASRGVLSTSQAPPVSHVRPSATVLFKSVALVYGPETAGVLLTGMGEDGALGLKAIHDMGGTTFAQDEATSVVYGMPRAAVELGAASYVLALDRIAPTVLSLLQSSR